MFNPFEPINLSFSKSITFNINKLLKATFNIILEILIKKNFDFNKEFNVVFNNYLKYLRNLNREK